MKKVLLFVVVVVLLGGLMAAKMMYDKMQSKKDIDALSTFEPPADFTPLLVPDNVKKEKAPIWDFRAKGPDVVPSMLEVLNDSTLGDGPRCAALIIVSHLAHKDAIDSVIEALKNTQGRLSECASVFLCLFYQEEVAEKALKVAKDAKSDDKVKLNAYKAMYGWATIKLGKESDRLKRKRNKHLKALAMEGLGEANLDCRKIAIRLVKEVSLDMESPEGKKSEVQQVAERLIPYVDSDDADLVAKSSDSLRILVGNMQHPIQILGEILPLWKSPKRELRILAIDLIGVIFKNEDSEISKEKEREKIHQILEDSDKEITLQAIKLMSEIGKTVEDRQALKKLTESADPDIAKAATDAQTAIMGRKD